MFVYELGKGGRLVVVTPNGWVENDGSQKGYLPAEDVQAVYDSIRLATAKGIIVAEAAGNGQMDLDQPFWRGRFDRSVRDSGAILVGAGDAFGEPLWFTNFGSRVDIFLPVGTVIRVKVGEVTFAGSTVLGELVGQ